MFFNDRICSLFLPVLRIACFPHRPAALFPAGFDLAANGITGCIVRFYCDIRGSYLLTLFFWEKLRVSQFRLWAIKGSFIAEFFLLLAVIADFAQNHLLLLALMNGVYGCFYWMSQRLLFKSLTSANSLGMSSGKFSNTSSGNSFGNFQLLVGVLLKVGILSGAFLLENQYSSALITMTFIISVVGYLGVHQRLACKDIQSALSAREVAFRDVIRFKDAQYSRTVFFLDGLFLFLESYFWVLSLYFLGNNNLTQLGSTIVILSIGLAIIFWLIKSRIDRLNVETVFLFSTLLYALSWYLRGALHPDLEKVVLYTGILAVAFFTSLFRLSFNKVFFDRAEQLAEKGKTQNVLLAKSYFSQMGVAVFFSALTLLFFMQTPITGLLSTIYWICIPLTLVFLLYVEKPLVLLAAARN